MKPFPPHVILRKPFRAAEESRLDLIVIPTSKKCQAKPVLSSAEVALEASCSDGACTFSVLCFSQPVLRLSKHLLWLMFWFTQNKKTVAILGQSSRQLVINF